MTKKKRQMSTWRAITYLGIISVITKLMVFLVTPTVFKSFIDQWDHSVYYTTLVIPFLTNGSLPYINYAWEYPIMMIVPVVLAAIPMVILQNEMAFFAMFPILMIVCDIVTTGCVYGITKSVYQSERRAFLAGAIFATAFSSAYFVLTKYDAFPTCLMMVALAATICWGNKRDGYIWSVLGYFTKIFPVAVLPFLVLYNAKKAGLKQEILSVLKVAVPITLLLAVPILVLNPAAIGTYLIETATKKEVFAPSLVYTVHSWIYFLTGTTVLPALTTIVSGILAITFLGLLYLVYRSPVIGPEYLLELVLCGVVALIAFSKYTSPQYMVWFTPILCILVSGSLGKIGLFYLWQTMEFIKFPLIFGKVYTNQVYVTPLPKVGGQVAMFFFTVEWAVLLYLVWKCAGTVTDNVNQ